MLRLVQLQHPGKGRRVAVAQDDELSLLRTPDTIYQLAQECLGEKLSLEQGVGARPVSETLKYDRVHQGHSDWKICVPLDQPEEPARCLVTGTGLTHRKSAENRQAMHAAQTPMTDSMRMYQWGVEGGRPARGKVGVAPEWFYKGCGTILRAHLEPLEVPSFALDGGEEAEVAGAYIIDSRGTPRRLGFVLANEFSDHETEEKNYLYLAHSKLRTCAIGPELIVMDHFGSHAGTIRLFRGKEVLWRKDFGTGEENMSHTVANLEHHHFKYETHRRPGDVHIHFFGADAFSFGEKIKLQDGDIMEIELSGFGRSLRNPLRVLRKTQAPRPAVPL